MTNGEWKSDDVMAALFNLGAIKIWPRDNQEGWRLHSGEWSPFYINLRGIAAKPDGAQALKSIGKAMATMLAANVPDATRLVAVATAGIPIGIATALNNQMPMCYTRRIDNVRTEEDLDAFLKRENGGKDTYGEHELVEGDLLDGDRIVIVDDLLTKGTTKALARKMIDHTAKQRGVKVTIAAIAVVVDRQHAEQKASDVPVHSLVPFREKGLPFLKERMSPVLPSLVEDYLKNPAPYQDSAQRTLKLRQAFLRGRKPASEKAT